MRRELQCCQSNDKLSSPNSSTDAASTASECWIWQLSRLWGSASLRCFASISSLHVLCNSSWSQLIMAMQTVSFQLDIWILDQVHQHYQSSCTYPSPYSRFVVSQDILQYSFQLRAGAPVAIQCDAVPADCVSLSQLQFAARVNHAGAPWSSCQQCRPGR